jgi:scyllo-inositol 2-dehydrogenase (NADP+)
MKLSDELWNFKAVLSNSSKFYIYYSFTKVNGWREKDIPGSGVLYDIGPHLIHQSLNLFGAPLTISAVVRNLRHNTETCSVDFFIITMEYMVDKKPLIVTLRSSMVAHLHAPRFTVHGTNATFSVNGLGINNLIIRPSRRAAFCRY